MTHKQYHDLIREAMEAESAELFIGEIGFPDWLADIYGDNTDALLSDLQNIYSVANMSTLDIRKAAGLTQEKFSQRFLIPRRTIENWESRSPQRNEPPHYLRLLMAESLGLVTVHHG